MFLLTLLLAISQQIWEYVAWYSRERTLTILWDERAEERYLMLPDLGRVLQGLRMALPGMCCFQKKPANMNLVREHVCNLWGFVPLHSCCKRPPSLPTRPLGMWNSKLGCDYTRFVWVPVGELYLHIYCFDYLWHKTVALRWTIVLCFLLLPN